MGPSECGMSRVSSTKVRWKFGGRVIDIYINCSSQRDIFT